MKLRPLLHQVAWVRKWAARPANGVACSTCRRDNIDGDIYMRAMEEDEVVLSDVHVYTDNAKSEFSTSLNENIPMSANNVLSRFIFEMNYGNNDTGTHEDEDGDLVVKRRKPRKEVITMEHAMSTCLQDVGLQVWLGSLLLCDYIIHLRRQLENQIILELGCGPGLCAIMSSAYADIVISTDVAPEILELCEKNLKRNLHIKNNDKLTCTIVKKLDWTEDTVPIDSDTPWSWNTEDLDYLNKATIILAADVIYDDNLTEAFFTTVTKLMSHSPKQLFISLEKRLNFTLFDLDVACPAYDFFTACLRRMQELAPQSGLKFNVSQIQIHFPQCFQYERTKYLELWKVTSSLPTTRETV